MPIFAFAGSLTRSAPNYGGANGRGLTTLHFDAARGWLDPVGEFNAIDDASWIEVDAAARRLYAVCEVPGTDRSWVASFAVGPAGRLTELGRQPTGGQTVCHASFSPDRKFLAVANYNAVVPPAAPDGAVDIFPIGADGVLGPAVASVRLAGSGPNPQRQERSHAHCVVPSPDGRRLYAADLGTDRVKVFAWSADGSLTALPGGDFTAPPGLGPRHLVFEPDGRGVFLISELDPVVLSLAVDPATGAMTTRDAFPIPRTGEAIVQPAGIVRTADGRYLFAGLRQCNEILGLAVDPATGKLTQTGRWRCGGATPRDLTLSPDGRFLVVANQDADRLTVFPVSGGQLGAPAQSLFIGTPMAIKLAEFPAS